MQYQCTFVALLWAALHSTKLGRFCWFACLLKDTEKRAENDTRPSDTIRIKVIVK